MHMRTRFVVSLLFWFALAVSLLFRFRGCKLLFACCGLAIHSHHSNSLSHHSTSHCSAFESDPNLVSNLSEPLFGYLLLDERLHKLLEERSETRPATAGKALEPERLSQRALTSKAIKLGTP